ncbi:MAG: bi-domain-containing oxidoreductase [Betaproteobacteria bacterium]|nr:bi-domain-containing oxidoreductase [Betaproteobacteria bacterium]
MKQILQSIKTGRTEVTDVPRPTVSVGQLLMRTRATMVSAGTERMLVEFGRAGWLEKARQQPDKVDMTLNKVRVDGLLPTIDAVMRKLDQPLPMGYCNVGEVVDIGRGVSGFSRGDRVASNGKHAEFVAVSVNLCARVPDAVDDESASFTVVGAIALQGIRLAQPTLGECVVVTGLGLIGLIAVQLLKSQGCRVLGLDFDPTRLELARRFGAETVNLSAGEDPIAAASRCSRGRGVDAVLIAASTRSNEPLHQAAQMCRKRGRIVLVGVAGLELSRADFFEKELSFQVSCSYGPGRYDPEYEEKGHDYPVGFVRWTEQRNFEAVLDMMSDGRLDVAPLVSHRFVIERAASAYDLISSDAPSLGVLLEYPQTKLVGAANDTTTLRISSSAEPAAVTLGFVGAGTYANSVLIPAFRDTAARLKAVSSATGVSGTYAARKNGIEFSSTDSDALLADADINALVVSTRHASHATWVCKALAAGKHVFVEKPLAMTHGELSVIENTYRNVIQSGRAPILMVGFNRRFAPQIMRLREILGAATGPKCFVMTVNAGAIPDSHWTQDPDVGGGRILGEACHFIDLLRFLAGSAISGHGVSVMRSNARVPDTASISLSFADGSIGTVHYFSNGHKAFPKERLEVFAQGRILQLDNFRKLTGHGWPGLRRMNLWRQDKGQKACAASFVHAIEAGGGSPIGFEELLEVSRVTIEVNEALH